MLGIALTTKLSLVAMAIAFLVLAAGIAAAVNANTGDSNEIHSCVSNNGQIHIVAAEDDCRKNESELNWNIVGLPGANGLPGLAGDDGQDGAAGPSGADGQEGSDGDTGPEGPVGPAGPAGSGSSGSEFVAYHSFSMLNSWINYSPSFNSAGYAKDSDGYVHLKGLVKSGAFNIPIARLPVGYRPELRSIFINITSGDSGRIDVYPNGNVVMINGTNAWVSLEGIVFGATN